VQGIACKLGRLHVLKHDHRPPQALEQDVAHDVAEPCHPLVHLLQVAVQGLVVVPLALRRRHDACHEGV